MTVFSILTKNIVKISYYFCILGIGTRFLHIFYKITIWPILTQFVILSHFRFLQCIHNSFQVKNLLATD